MEELIQQLSAELNCPASYVQNVVTLIDEGNTIPFIARYRKELHGGMDDTALRTLADRLTYLRNLAQRRDEITRSIAAQEKLTDELSSAIQAAKTLAELEDTAVDMFTTVFVGNAATQILHGRMVTPRGYRGV